MKYVVGIFTFLLGLSISGIVYFHILRHDEVYDQIEVTNQNFKIRITAYAEKGVMLPGVYYVFRSAPINSDKWQDVLTARGDEPWPIRREQLGMVSDRTGYGFMSTYYLVTTDAGNNWSIWDAEKRLLDLDNQKQTNLTPYIEEVQMQPDGNGRMRFRKSVSKQERGPDVYTSDYGVNWFVKE